MASPIESHPITIASSPIETRLESHPTRKENHESHPITDDYNLIFSNRKTIPNHPTRKEIESSETTSDRSIAATKRNPEGWEISLCCRSFNYRTNFVEFQSFCVIDWRFGFHNRRFPYNEPVFHFCHQKVCHQLPPPNMWPISVSGRFFQFPYDFCKIAPLSNPSVFMNDDSDLLGLSINIGSRFSFCHQQDNRQLPTPNISHRTPVLRYSSQFGMCKWF